MNNCSHKFSRTSLTRVRWYLFPSRVRTCSLCIYDLSNLKKYVATIPIVFEVYLSRKIKENYNGVAILNETFKTNYAVFDRSLPHLAYAHRARRQKQRKEFSRRLFRGLSADVTLTSLRLPHCRPRFCPSRLPRPRAQRGNFDLSIVI